MAGSTPTTSSSGACASQPLGEQARREKHSGEADRHVDEEHPKRPWSSRLAMPPSSQPLRAADRRRGPPARARGHAPGSRTALMTARARPAPRARRRCPGRPRAEQRRGEDRRRPARQRRRREQRSGREHEHHRRPSRSASRPATSGTDRQRRACRQSSPQRQRGIDIQRSACMRRQHDGDDRDVGDDHELGGTRQHNDRPLGLATSLTLEHAMLETRRRPRCASTVGRPRAGAGEHDLPPRSAARSSSTC